MGLTREAVNNAIVWVNSQADVGATTRYGFALAIIEPLGSHIDLEEKDATLVQEGIALKERRSPPEGSPTDGAENPAQRSDSEGRSSLSSEGLLATTRRHGFLGCGSGDSTPTDPEMLDELFSEKFLGPI